LAATAPPPRDEQRKKPNMNDVTAQDLANALSAVLRPQTPLDPGQQRVALQYRLIRNGLGNYGGHGDTGGDTALVRLNQTVVNGRIWLAFEDPLPFATARLVVYSGAPPRQIDTIPISDPTVSGVWVWEGKGSLAPIVRVDVLDRGGAPIAAGVPTQRILPALGMTQTVANSLVSRLTFDDRLPDTASRLVLHLHAPGQRQLVVTHRDIDPQERDYLVIDDTDDIELIEYVDVLDDDGVPVATGVPSHDRRRVSRQSARS
jgi:hypothetical protein